MGFSLRAPDGRRWSPKEWVQGRPLGHPTHAMLVHYPVAFSAGVLGLDVIARRGGDEPGLVRAAAYLAAGAAAAGLVAAVPGLVDWWGMKPGSRTRRVANKHLLLQSFSLALLVATAAIRWPNRSDPVPSAAATVLSALAVATILWGNYFGGELVYRIGFRVTTGGGTPPPRPSGEPR